MRYLIFFLGLSYLTIVGCSQGMQTNGSLQSQTNSNPPSSITSTSTVSDPFQDLRIQYDSADSRVVFRHHSGDKLFIYNYPKNDVSPVSGGTAPNPKPGPPDAPVIIEFYANGVDAQNATQMAFLSATQAVLATQSCSSGSCYITMPAVTFEIPSCLSGQWAPIPSPYQVQITYSDGTKKSSQVVMGDPCGNYFAKTDAARRTNRGIASISTNQTTRLPNILWMLAGVLGTLVSLFLVRITKPKTK